MNERLKRAKAFLIKIGYDWDWDSPAMQSQLTDFAEFAESECKSLEAKLEKAKGHIQGAITFLDTWLRDAGSSDSLIADAYKQIKRAKTICEKEKNDAG